MSNDRSAWRLAELVRRRHETVNPRDPTDLAARWIVLEEVRNAAGYGATRSADVMAISLWPSDGLDIIGYEIKVSRGDLKKELADPSKAAQSGAQCDEWWLVVWDAKLLGGFEIPAEWGILARQDGERGDEELVVVRKAPRRKLKREDRAVDRHDLAVLLRAAVRSSAGAWRFARTVAEAERSGRAIGRDAGRAEERHELGEILRPLQDAWRLATCAQPWDTPKPDALARWAVEQLQAPAQRTAP